jgi:hypothetical protein
VRGRCRKFALQIKNMYVCVWGGGVLTIFSTSPLIPSYATAANLTVVDVNRPAVLFMQSEIY